MLLRKDFDEGWRTKDLEMKPGIQIGLITEQPFGKSKFALQIGILYTQLGSKFEYKTNKTNKPEPGEFTVNNLQFHGHLQFKHKILLLHAGPYWSYGLGAKINSEKYSGTDLDKLSDLGIGVGAALVIGNMCYIGVSYNTGHVASNTMATLTLMFGK
jgi:hypothetical protein